MSFDDILDDGRLWAVRYDGDVDNILYILFNQWNDIEWLTTFFRANIKDLSEYFKITDLNQAIYDTKVDADELECLILDSNPGTDLDKLFKPLENLRGSEMQEREHTIEELPRLEMVRNMLLAEGVTDLDGFYDLVVS